MGCIPEAFLTTFPRPDDSSLLRVRVAKDELRIKPGTPGSGQINVIEWDHMDLKKFLPAALLSTWTIRTALYPLSVLRSRMQLQKQHTVYRNTFHAFSDIAKVEGIRGLYRGFWVTVPQIGCSFIYSTVYEKTRAVLSQDFGYKSSAGISCLAGSCASFCSQVIFVPTDIVAQYMMIYHKAEKLAAGNDRAVMERLQANKDKGSLGVRTLKAICAVDGIKGFYRGFWASASVYVPICFVFWPTYYWVLDGLHALHPPTTRTLLLDQTVAAICGGITSTLCTNPFEMLRIRTQMHRGTYKDNIERMIRNEGWSVLTKGLTPRLIANSLNSCVVMVGYEIAKRLCVLPEYKDRVKW